MDSFPAMLLKISGRLSEEDVDDLKFLCQNEIVKKKRETIKQGTDLFSQLLEQALISEDDLSFLITLLNTIHRKDLVKDIERFQATATRCRRREKTAEDEAQDRDQLLQAFNILCNYLWRDWRSLMRTLGVKDMYMACIAYDSHNTMEDQIMLCLLHWWQVEGDSATVSALMRALKHCKMTFVAEKLAEGLNLNHWEM